MTPTIESSAPLGRLATLHPAVTRVFHRHGLDFCCGGGTSLGEACGAAGLDVEAVAREVEAAMADGAPGADWATAEPAALIEHLLEAFHAPHRDELPRLIAMARKVEDVHGDKADCPTGLADHLSAMLESLEDHMQKEEQVLFPLVLAGRGPMAAMPISVMEAEHQEHGANLARMRALAGDYDVPAGACTTWRALLMGVRQLERDLMEHIHLENNVLFPGALASA